ncbi:MAG: MerR family transcriptional regulator [Propionibacteriales bacterium]|nr:MerR family transcriptional regulator [Propionibacteriales bacterium]
MERTWRIGEVAERTGLSRRTLRHYDELGLLVPAARGWNDYRRYDAGDLMRLLQIQNLKALGLSLGEIAEALNDPSLDATAALRGHWELLTERIATEQRLADRLQALAETADRSWEDVLEVIALTRLSTHTDPIARLRAALLPDGRSTEELFDALAIETDPGVQEVLIWALAGRPGVAELARTRLATAGGDSRRLLIRLLSKAGDRDAVAVLVPLLGDADPAVVVATVAALRQLPDRQAAAGLAALLGVGVVDDAELSDALVAIGTPAAPAVLVRLADATAEVRLAAADALGALAATDGSELAVEHPEVVAGLIEAADDPHLPVRRSALVALADLGPAGRVALTARQDDPAVGSLARRLLRL